MTEDREALLRTEAERAAELEAIVSTLSEEEAAEANVNEDGWSVKALVYHIAHWQSVGAAAIAGQTGVYAGSDTDLDRENARVLERSSELSLAAVLDEWALARTRSREALAAVEAPSQTDLEWFTEEGVDHMATHLAELVAWNGRR